MTKNTTSWFSELGSLLKLKPKKSEAMVVEGYTIAPECKVGSDVLVLNGAGVRTVNDEKVYALALYLPAKTKRTDTARALLGARRVQFIILQDTVASNFIDSLRNSIQANVNETAQEFIKDELEQLEKLLQSLRTLKAGDVADFDWIPSRGAFVYLNGEMIGQRLRGMAIYDAVLSIWLGSNALQENLKEGLMNQ